MRIEQAFRIEVGKLLPTHNLDDAISIVGQRFRINLATAKKWVLGK